MNALAMPPAWQGPLPEATPPPDMAIYQLPTGTYESRAAFAFTGGSLRDKRAFAATAILVAHPQGDLLIDAGFGSGVAAHQIHEYDFGSAPYLGFPSSYDVHGDGSVVVALAGGHTTGSVIIFVALPDGRRYAFIGDVAWQLEGVRRPAERPLLMRKLADVDPDQVREDLLRVASLANLVQVVPAHDVGAYDGIVRLPVRWTTPSGL